MPFADGLTPLKIKEAIEQDGLRAPQGHFRWASAENPVGESASERARIHKSAEQTVAGHYNYYNIPGNLESIWRFYFWALECAFKWLNRRGGKRKSFTWKAFNKAIEILGIATPKMRIVNRRHRVFA